MLEGLCRLQEDLRHGCEDLRRGYEDLHREQEESTRRLVAMLREVMRRLPKKRHS
jgi:hypothetical protein